MEKNIIMLAMIGFCMAFVSFIHVVNAADPPPLQDFCVGVDDYKSSVFINGKFCKNPKDVTIQDFLYKGFDIPSNTSNSLAANALLINDALFPAVNTLGISIGRIDFGPFGLNQPHLHPLGSEIFAVLEGTLYIGFVTTDNKLFDAVIKKGDVVVFPQGLIHFQLNIGRTNALAIAGFGSQNPGRTNIANALFGTTPPIFSDVLTKAFQVNEKVIQKLHNQFIDEDDSIETGRSLLKLITEAT
ncbi:germin-like protein subfamily 1 member 16 [Silene latifolia]|uniref:germin-like protein subfamily 1 member 16 n=1 Tax=Silene latifolia TaxID=37657 RepID=UPI003D78114D